MSGIGLLIINIFSSLLFRLASSALARESDMLVFISKTRYWHWLNLLVFLAGTLSGVIWCLRAGQRHVLNGDYCLAEATGGSLGFMTWWIEWALDDFPLGAGAVHAKGEPVKNPWALKAAELQLARPKTGNDYLQAHIGSSGLAAGYMDGLEPADMDLFLAYQEFMHHHFELQGQDCVGYDTSKTYALAVLGLGGFLIYFLFARNARSYWLVATPCWGVDDPYDMSHTYKDFKARAKIGQQLADRDQKEDGSSGDGFIDAYTELRPAM